MKIALRGPAAELSIAQAPARALPFHWEAWRDALIRGTALAPAVEEYTEPEGWAVTIVEAVAGDALDIHAFYAVFDHALHLVATLPANATSELRARVRQLFKQAAPVWDDELVALVDL